VSLVKLDERKCIFGDEIDGRCDVGEPKEYLVLLKGAWAKICQTCTEASKTNAELFTASFTAFSGNLNEKINGRLCAYPREGYDGPLRGMAKKPIKSGREAGYFNLKGHPALCFTDLKPSREAVELTAKEITKAELEQK